MKMLETPRTFWNISFNTFFVWFCFVQLFGIVVWYLGDVSKLEIGETMAGCIRIVKFSLHLFGFVLLCGVALKLFRMSVNMKDTLSALLIMFSFLLVM